MNRRACCILLILALLPAACAALADTPIDETNFPDPVFREIVQGFDKNKDGTLSDREAKAVQKLDCSGKAIGDLTGIQLFTSLRNLNAGENRLTALDLSGLAQLQEVYCRNNPLLELNVSDTPKLQHLDCESTFMTELDLSGCPALDDLCVTNMSSLTSLSLANNPKMKKLWTLGSGLTTVRIGSCPELIKVYETERSVFGNGYMYADKNWNRVLVVNGNAAVDTAPDLQPVRAESLKDFRGTWNLYSMTLNGVTYSRAQLDTTNTNITCVVTDRDITVTSGQDKAVADIELVEEDGTLKAVNYDGSINIFFLIADGKMASVYDSSNGECTLVFSRK